MTIPPPRRSLQQMEEDTQNMVLYINAYMAAHDGEIPPFVDEMLSSISTEELDKQIQLSIDDIVIAEIEAERKYGER